MLQNKTENQYFYITYERKIFCGLKSDKKLTLIDCGKSPTSFDKNNILDWFNRKVYFYL